MLGYVFIATVYIDSNIEIAIEVTMYYFQSLNGKRKKKKEYGLDFSFKYLQKRNIRKEKHHQNQTQDGLKHHPYPDSGSHKVYSQSSRKALAGSLRSPSQAIHHVRPRSPIPLPIPSCSKSPYGVSVPNPCASISKESYPPTPFPFSATGHHHNRQS